MCWCILVECKLDPLPTPWMFPMALFVYQPGKPLTSANSVRTHLTSIPNRTAKKNTDIPSWIETTRQPGEFPSKSLQSSSLPNTLSWSVKKHGRDRKVTLFSFHSFTPFLFNTVIFRVEGHIIHTCRQDALCQSNNGCELRSISKMSKLLGSKTLDTGTRSQTRWLLSASSYIRSKSKFCLSMTRFKKPHCCPTRPTYTNVKWKTEGCTATAQTSPKLRHHTRQCIAWTLSSGHGRHILSNNQNILHSESNAPNY